jgi:molecular chaperone GrpE
MTEETNVEQPPAVEEAIDYKDKYLRLLADVENTRKRMQKEKQEMVRFGIENILGEVLGPMDNLENALKHADKLSGEVKNWAMGFQMILAQFKDVLSQNGVAPFVSEGQRFDPAKHEAVEMEETDQVPDGMIMKEFVKGYSRGDHVIRPARVKVAKKLTIKEEKGEENEQEEE